MKKMKIALIDTRTETLSRLGSRDGYTFAAYLVMTTFRATVPSLAVATKK